MEEIKSGMGEVVALIIHSDDESDGVNFLSKEDYPLQLAVSLYDKGMSVMPHIHLRQDITINNIQEVVHIDRGKARVNLYDSEGNKITSRDLSGGDTIFLISGGHGLEILEDTKVIEVKQGPYLGKDRDKQMIEE